MTTAEVQIERGGQEDQEVTPLELFFDLVLVFAITQVTGFISADPTWTRLVEGLAILPALWWAWVSYAWLANTTASDEGAARVVSTHLAALPALAVVAALACGLIAGEAMQLAERATACATRATS